MKKSFLFVALVATLAMFSCNKPADPKTDPKPDPKPEPTEQARILDDFEGEGILAWTGADGAEFSLVANPSKTGINTSEQCGKVLASGAQWEFTWSTGFGATEDGGFNFLNFSTEGYIVKIDVYTAKANVPVFLKMEGVDVDACEISTVGTSKVNEWETLEFDYEPFALVDGAYKNFVILFDAGVTTEGGEEFYFDNVRLCKE